MIDRISLPVVFKSALSILISLCSASRLATPPTGNDRQTSSSERTPTGSQSKRDPSAQRPATVLSDRFLIMICAGRVRPQAAHHVRQHDRLRQAPHGDHGRPAEGTLLDRLAYGALRPAETDTTTTDGLYDPFQVFSVGDAVEDVERQAVTTADHAEATGHVGQRQRRRGNDPQGLRARAVLGVHIASDPERT